MLSEKTINAMRIEAHAAEVEHGHFNSFHEAYAILLDEVDQLWDEIKKHNHDKDNIYAEAIQVAACAARLAEMTEWYG